MAVNGTFIINVVGYDRYKTCAPSFLTIVLSASNALLNFLVAAGPVVLLLLLEILFILILLLLLPPPIPSPLIAFTSLGQFPPNCICILCFTVSNGVCTASPTIVANAPALASATNSPYADDDDDDDDDPIGFKRNIFFPYSYVAKYTACAGPAPNPPATTPRYRPFTPSVFKIDRIAFGIVLLIIFIELVLLLLLVKEEEEEAEEEEEEDAAAATSCIRVFTVSTGNITVCSIVPANAPANMCCVYSIDDFCRDDDESVVVFMVVFVVVVVVVFMVSRKSSPERKRLLVYEMMCRKRIK
jgi:hypothetical protein